MAQRTYLAVDLGASGGRVVAGRLDGRRLTLEDVHRVARTYFTETGRMRLTIMPTGGVQQPVRGVNR